MGRVSMKNQKTNVEGRTNESSIHTCILLQLILPMPMPFVKISVISLVLFYLCGFVIPMYVTQQLAKKYNRPQTKIITQQNCIKEHTQKASKTSCSANYKTPPA